MADSNTRISRSEASEAARKLAQKKNSWNPFNTASDAGKTLEEWKEEKRVAPRTGRRLSSQTSRGRAQSQRKSPAAASGTRRSTRALRKSPSVSRRTRAGKAMGKRGGARKSKK